VAEDAEKLADLIVRTHDDPAFNRAAARSGLALANGEFADAAISQAMARALGSSQSPSKSSVLASTRASS
jgi:hypothetical protein